MSAPPRAYRDGGSCQIAVTSGIEGFVNTRR